MQYVNILGRVIFGGYFFYSGLNHFINLKMMSGYAQSKKAPMPTVSVVITGLMLLAGSISYLFNFHLIIGSGLLILFLLSASFMMHNYWTITDPMQKMGEMVNFLKNFALIGALLLMLSVHYSNVIAF
jgi:uncharacterized membrane protein YphA (DoxX/SURF4 family)